MGLLVVFLRWLPPTDADLTRSLIDRVRSDDLPGVRQCITAGVDVNAVRYSNEGGAIRIRSRCDAGTVRVSIQDTGIGIPPGSLKKIFERFYRVDASRPAHAQAA